MKLRTCVAAGVLGASICGVAAAVGPPPLDRPSPPPCCADGLCYPKPNTWGWYETRWRRWPTEYLAPLPPELRPPPPLPADIPPYQTPTPEQEDIRAPEPTRPPDVEDRPVFEPAPPLDAVPPVVPPTVPVTPTPVLPFEEPLNGVPAVPLMPPEPPPTTLPFGEPMGDADPPPALPFAAPVLGESPTGRALRPANGTTHGPTRGVRPAYSNDPPPAPPVTLAG